MKSYPYLLFLILPFGVGASIEFFPFWISMPLTVIQSFFWVWSVSIITGNDINENS